MARAGATDEAVEIALKTPTLGVGCHVVLMDGEPVLGARSDIPNLVDPKSGRFRSSLPSFLAWLFYDSLRSEPSHPGAAREIEAEAAAQIALLQGRGLRLTHIDTHKHTHMFPAVLRPVLRAARAAGICAVRNHFEPAWSLRATGGSAWLRRAEVSLLRRLFERSFKKIVAEEGFRTTDGAIGVLATGTLDSATVSSLLKHMPPGTWELVTHPGYNDAELAAVTTRLRESRVTEIEALKGLRLFPNLKLKSFAGF
jgi:predicted glycoside hydrolase/deacetylase ChbG (UPF0249 family)